LKLSIKQFHFFGRCVVSAKEIHQKTGIPLRTVERHIQKLVLLNVSASAVGHRWLHQLSLVPLGQHIFRNSAIMTRHLALLAENEHNTLISHMSIWRHMRQKKGLP